MTSAPKPRHYRTVDEIRDLERLSGPRVRKQHVTSQAILRRWVAGENHAFAGRVGSINIGWPDAEPKFYYPARTGYIKDFVRFASQTMEAVWQETENRLPQAIDACLNKTVFDCPDLMVVLKNAIVMHHVRNGHMPKFLEPAWHRAMANLRRSMLTEHRHLIEREFARRYPGLTAGPGCLEAVFDDALIPVQALREEGGFFRDSLERLFRLGVEVIASSGLEVCTPGSGEFIIGDAPALAIADDGRIGLRDRVGLNEAITIALPVTPTCLISLGDADAYVDLAEEQVDYLNDCQVRGAAQHVLFRPGSGLDKFIRSRVGKTAAAR